MWRLTRFENKTRASVLRPCCVEWLVGFCKALISLVSARNVLQHEIGKRTNQKMQEVLAPQRHLLAIPAGFEPATHGVEIRYSIVIFARPLPSADNQSEILTTD